MSQTPNSSHIRTELLADRHHACAAERHEPTIRSQSSGSEPRMMGRPLSPPPRRRVPGWAPPPPSLATTDAPPCGDVARHEEAGMRARMSV